MIRGIVSALLIAMIAAAPALAGTGFKGAKNAKKVFAISNDVGNNDVEFISEAPMEKIHGHSSGVSGEFVLNPTDLESTSGKMIVKVRSMKTAITKRDNHMYSETWLDADKYPEIMFMVKGLKNVKTMVKDGRKVATATAYGDFTCHGVTKPTEAQVTITYIEESSATQKRAAGDLAMIEAKFDVALADFNVKGYGDIIGSKVGKVINIDAHLFANSGSSGS